MEPTTLDKIAKNTPGLPEAKLEPGRRTIMTSSVDANGELGTALSLEVCRELSPADIKLSKETTLGISPQNLRRLRASHHKLARLLAAGKRPSECHAITGYSLSRISILQNDPAFKELLGHYTQKNEEIEVALRDRLSQLSHDAIMELGQRLEESPEEVSVSQLMEMVKMGADRSDAPPISKQVNEGGGGQVTINLINAIKEASQNGHAGNIRTIRQDTAYLEGKSSGPTAVQNNSGFEVGGFLPRPSTESNQEAEVKGE